MEALPELYAIFQGEVRGVPASAVLLWLRSLLCLSLLPSVVGG